MGWFGPYGKLIFARTLGEWLEEFAAIWLVLACGVLFPLLTFLYFGR